eukprot:CAMPEP_0178851100 /NCGR_PEP_ID=MMETSP0746-20121128/20924_1 /TAXON_ID=913974 /ORGANISM="Nitzschia punctata, Strain CCMP561" /LENGTH=46 /DNA_ID= /DNA_START= /DNA_END= /DNA_ORIENTATION=
MSYSLLLDGHGQQFVDIDNLDDGLMVLRWLHDDGNSTNSTGAKNTT